MVRAMAARMEISSGRIILKARELRRSRGRPSGRVRTYEFDPTERELRGNGNVPARLTPQEASVLMLLTSNAPASVSRKTIETTLWENEPPDDSDQRINDLIQRVRVALHDSPQKHDFIETIPGFGYKFVGTLDRPATSDGVPDAVDRPALEPRPNTAQQAAPSSAEMHRAARLNKKIWQNWIFWGFTGIVMVGAALGFYFIASRTTPPLKTRRVISNSPERPIRTAVISPDAKYLAYSDEARAYVFEIDSGETHQLTLLTGETPVNLSWFPSSTKLLIVTADRSGEQTQLREISIFNDSKMGSAIQQDVGEAAMSQDNSHIASTSRSGKYLFIQQLGDAERQVLITGGDNEAFRNLSWTRNGKLVVGHVRFDGSSYSVTIELVDTVNRRATRLLSNTRVSGGCAITDGGLLFSTVDQQGAELFTADLDLAGGKLRGSPHSIMRTPNTAVYMLSASREGRNIAYLQGPYQADAFTAILKRNSRLELQNPERLTLDDSNDLPTAWSHDGSSILFHSDRLGSWKIFAQKIGESKADVIVDGPGDYKGARLTSDGKWLLFLAYPRSSKSHASIVTNFQAFDAKLRIRIMRMPASGGVHHELMSGPLLSVRCPSVNAAYCIVCEPGLTGATFSQVDPESGQRSKMRSVAASNPAYWDISPDGRDLAIASSRGTDGVIRKINLQNGSATEIMVKNEPNLQSMDWAPDGNGWFVSSRWTQWADLLYVDQKGNYTVLRRQSIAFETWGLPYSDGHRFAFLEWSAAGSPWLLTR